MAAMTEPRRLRMFPLGSVLFPSMVLPLHIFEPRYLEMIAECESEQEQFGVVLIERGFEVGGGDQRFDVGTEARIVDTADLDDGRRVVVAVGTERFRVLEWLEDDPYPQAMVETLLRPPAETDVHVADLDRLFQRLLAVVSESGVDVGSVEYELSPDPGHAVDQLSTMAPLGSLDRQRLLEADRIETQAAMLADLLTDTIAVVQAQMSG